MQHPPGTERIKRFVPKLRYELIGCGLNGHELLGVGAAKVRPQDSVFVREYDGKRWHRCLRCDSWLPLPVPKKPIAEFPPDESEVAVPLRGKPLRDRYVLRLIALDRASHVLLLGSLAALIFLVAIHRNGLEQFYVRLFDSLQQGNSGVSFSGELAKLQHVLSLPTAEIFRLGFLVSAYALLEAVEMVGLWLAKRWAEYLTFLATIVFIPLEIYELIHKPTVLKVAAFIINVAIAIYLLYAKRLFGLRGGGKAEAAERLRDTGWPAIRRSTP